MDGSLTPWRKTTRDQEATLYTYIWEFQVDPANREAFQHAYGPRGPWVHLFSRAPGYLRTELHQDITQTCRYVTVDSWESESAWKSFRARFADEFDSIDRECEQLTLAEREIGHFTVVDETPPAAPLHRGVYGGAKHKSRKVDT